MRKLLIFCFVTVLICCDTTTQKETKPHYSSYFIEYAGLTPQSFIDTAVKQGGTARDYRQRVEEIPLDEYPSDAPPPVHETMGFSSMKSFIHSRPQMHDSYEECLLQSLEDAGACFTYFVEKPRDYLYYLYIEGRD